MKIQQSNSGKGTAAILQHNTIPASEKDCKILFDALMNPPGPNQKLLDAVERYKILMHKLYEGYFRPVEC